MNVVHPTASQYKLLILHNTVIRIILVILFSDYNVDAVSYRRRSCQSVIIHLRLSIATNSPQDVLFWFRDFTFMHHPSHIPPH